VRALLTVFREMPAASASAVIAHPAPHDALVDANKRSRAERGQQPLPAVRFVVDQRAGGQVWLAFLEVAGPELPEGLPRRFDLAARDRLDEPAASGDRRPSAREAAARRQRAVGLPE